MIQQPNPETSLLRAIGPTVQVNWFARAWKYSTGMRTVLWYAFGTLIALIAIAVCAKTIGWAWVSWAIGCGILITGIVIGTPLFAGATIPVWFAGILRHQAGGTPGPSAEDGFIGAWDYVKGLWQFFRGCLFYLPLVFFGIAFFRVEDNLVAVVPFLGLSLVLSIAYAGTGGTFFRNIIVVVYTGLILWLLGTWIPAVAERQQQFTQWWTLNVSRNLADRAGSAADADQHAKNTLAAKTCFANLKTVAQPTQEDKDRCEALRKNVGTYYKNAAEQQRAEANARMRQARVNAAANCWKGVDEKSRPEAIAQCEALDRDIDKALVTATPTAPPPPHGNERTGGTTTTTTARSEGPWQCHERYRSIDYAPSEQFGVADAGTLPAGRYEIAVSGKTKRAFYTNGRHAQDCEIDGSGGMGVCTSPEDGRRLSSGLGRPWVAPLTPTGASPVLLPLEAYGKFVLHLWGRPLPLEDGRMAVEIGQDAQIGFNVNHYQHAESYRGSGVLRVTIKKCV